MSLEAKVENMAHIPPRCPLGKEQSHQLSDSRETTRPGLGDPCQKEWGNLHQMWTHLPVRGAGPGPGFFSLLRTLGGFYLILITHVCNENTV